jgi:hypothetical protein
VTSGAEQEPSKIRWRLADFYDAAIDAAMPELTATTPASDPAKDRRPPFGFINSRAVGELVGFKIVFDVPEDALVTLATHNGDMAVASTKLTRAIAGLS